MHCVISLKGSQITTLQKKDIMKIGILTLPLHTNYGGILQAYALQEVLRRLGHEVNVINKDRTPERYSFYQNFKINVYQLLSHVVRGKRYTFRDLNKIESENSKSFYYKTQNTRKFIEKYIKTIDVHSYSEDIQKSSFDAIIVGSDQIWSQKHGGCIDGSVVNAYLPFLSNKYLRFSYAASFGNDYWEYNALRTWYARKAIKKFKCVSVREQSGIELCRKNLHIQAVQHIDPTMLLTKEDYLSLVHYDKFNNSTKKLLVYFLDETESKMDIVDYLEKKLFLTRNIVNSKAEDLNAKQLNLCECIQPPVENWLAGFEDSDFVVTDSFHACVFSILFHKPFFVIGNKARGMARFTSLLGQFGLSDRLITNIHDIETGYLSYDIDFAPVDDLLRIERERSISYLQNCLK